MPIDENGQIRERNMFNDEIRQWRSLPDASRARAWTMAERLFVGGSSLDEIREYTLVPLKNLLIHIRDMWRSKFDAGAYAGTEFLITREQWDTFMKQPARGPERRPLTEQEVAIRLDYAQGMGYRALATKYKITRDRARDVVNKHDGVQRTNTPI